MNVWTDDDFTDLIGECKITFKSDQIQLVFKSYDHVIKQQSFGSKQTQNAKLLSRFWGLISRDAKTEAAQLKVD